MKILILGANGMIGHKIYQYLDKKMYKIIIHTRNPITAYSYSNFFSNHFDNVHFDLSNFYMITSYLEKINPDIIINCAGITTRRGIDRSNFEFIKLNTLLPNILSEWVKSNEKKLIHFSTDCVFNGQNGPYLDSDLPDANDLYGKTKSLGEVTNKYTLTIRSSMIGLELENKTELLEWLLTNNNRDIEGYDNAFYSGVSTIQMAKYINLILEKFIDLAGVINISSLPISKYNLLNLLIKKFNLNTKLTKNINYKSNKILNSDIFHKLIGQQQLKWQDMLDDLIHDYTSNKIYYN